MNTFNVILIKQIGLIVVENKTNKSFMKYANECVSVHSRHFAGTIKPRQILRYIPNQEPSMHMFTCINVGPNKTNVTYGAQMNENKSSSINMMEFTQ